MPPGTAGSVFKGVAVNGTPPVPLNRLDLRRALALVADPEHGLELRGLPSGRSRVRPSTDLEGLVDAAQSLADDRGVYYCLNPVSPTMGDRGAKAQDVIKRRWLLIDADAVRGDDGKDQSATEDEKERARLLAAAAQEYLAGLEWPAPALVDSGNGYHLLYRIDLPNDRAAHATCKRVLYALAARFDTDGAKIDRAVHNAARVAKLPGTWARKGTPTAARPHRLARLEWCPADGPQVVTREQLLVVGGPESEEPQPSPAPDPADTSSVFRGRAGGSSPDAAYVRAALENEVLRVVMARRGERNDALNRAAYSLGGLIGPGLLTELQVVEGLREAAARCGLDVDPNCGSRGIEATIRSGLTAGKDVPRAVPEGNARPSRPAQEAAYSRPEETVPPPRKPIIEIFTLPDILAMEIPPPKWAVPGILSEGLTLLAGKPKLGKSFMALNLAITVAAGGLALGNVQTEPGEVLYLSLEDRLRRVQSRARRMLQHLGVEASRRLHVAVEWPRQGDGGLAEIVRWLERSSCPRLVIIDVWQKFRPNLKQGSQYEQDYNHSAALKSALDAAQCSGLALHHCKKAKADDVVDEISGTLGLAGAADGTLILTRARNDLEAELFVGGRDVSEDKLAIVFDPDQFVWRSLGRAGQHTESKLKAQLIDLFKANAGSVLGTGDITAALELPADKHQTLRTYLGRMATEGLIARAGPGRFRWPVEHPIDGATEPI
jgi:hypothetical protein